MSGRIQKWRVLKFGGGSTSTPEEWRTLISVVQDRLREGLRPFLVFAAMHSVTRRLATLVDQAPASGAGDELDEIRNAHVDLAGQLGIELTDDFLRSEIESMRVALDRLEGRPSVPPAARAAILSSGERLMTELAGTVLEGEGLRTTVIDATAVLETGVQPGASTARRYLRAECRAGEDPALRRTLERIDTDLIITQGFVAGNQDGEPVLLGWGGSDTSASCFATKLGADKVELWKNVPGFFTTDPTLTPSARLLRRLDYREAEEIARAGAEVVHPKAIGPLRDAGIPLEIRSILDPSSEHTVVGQGTVRGSQVKAIAARRGITLISVDTPRMWHEVGFLARLFQVIAEHDLSVDLVATSETNVTLSIDPVYDLDQGAIERALSSLQTFCHAAVIGPCAVVSLIGRDLRSILPDLAPALAVMDEQPVRLLSQSASDLDFAFVVDEPQANRIVQRLHSTFFDHQPIDEIFGPSWGAIAKRVASTSIDTWWADRREELLAIAKETSPVYVYDETTLRRQVTRLVGLDALDRVFYATKANWNDAVLETFYEEGIGFECVSPGEIRHVRDVLPDLDRTRILFTPNFAPRDDYAFALREGVWVTLDNVHPLEAWPDLFEDREVLLRIDPGRGQGHHKHVRTAGSHSKFGISPEELEKVARLAKDAGLRIIGLHAHVGSGVKAADAWIDTARKLASHLHLFPDARILNVGGGLGVIERPGDPPLDLTMMEESLATFHAEHSHLELWMEPGRFLVSEAGVLLTTVTQLKKKGNVRYVGVDTGFNSLLRPALYGAHHEIVNLTRYDEHPEIVAEVVGPICETGDVLGHGRALPTTSEGDVMLIATAGAYGRVMGSSYNLRPPASEVFLESEE